MKRLKAILETVEDEPKQFGTNCGNCIFFRGKKEKIDDKSLNMQGGVISPDDKHLKLAKKGDLVTLPGTEDPTVQRMCTHKDIDQVVNDRMCCAYWDNPGAYREFDE